MQMRPIVDGLKSEFEASVAFVYLDAQDTGEGQAAFASLALPGHPSYVVFDAGGVERYRAFGVVEAAVLRRAIQAALDG